MFTFLNSSILLALAAVALPLILHLFNRQRRKNVPFSSIRFFKMLEKQRLKRLKLYQYLLILVRTLIILFLVFAFARPTYTGENGLGSARSTAVIILDDGVHMRRYDEDGGRFFRAVNKVREIATQFQPEDRVFFLTAHSGNQINSDLEQLQCSFQKPDWVKTFRRAKELFTIHPNFNRELYIVSDFQFTSPDWTLIEPFDATRCFLFPIQSGDVQNVSIDTVRFTNTLFEINKTVQLDVLIRNHSDQSADDAECHLYINQKRVAHQRINLNPGESKALSLSFQPRSFGELKGYLEIDDDDLIADNRYYFSMNIPKRLEILYVDDNPSSFIEAAWTALQTNSNITITEDRPRSWGRQVLTRYQTVCLANFANIQETLRAKLNTYVQNGGGLILIPGINTIPADFNRLAQDLNIGIRCTELIETKRAENFFSLVAPSLNHPIFSGLFRTLVPEIEKPRFRRYFKFTSVQQDMNILNLNNGDPFLSTATNGKGSVYVIGSYIDESWTDLQYRGLFIPLFVRLFYLSSAMAAQNQSSALVGQTVDISLEELQREFFRLIGPEGQETKVIPATYDPQLFFSLTNMDQPGHYTLQSGDETLHTISANVPASDISSDPVDFSILSDQATIFEEDKPFTEKILQARIGVELWRWALVISLLLIMAELILVKFTEGKN